MNYESWRRSLDIAEDFAYQLEVAQDTLFDFDEYGRQTMVAPGVARWFNPAYSRGVEPVFQYAPGGRFGYALSQLSVPAGTTPGELLRGIAPGARPVLRRGRLRGMKLLRRTPRALETGLE